LETAGQQTAPYEVPTLGNDLKSVKVCYGASKYLSHARVARVYRDLIRSHSEVVSEISLADIVLLHFEPHSFRSLVEAYPALKRRYLVGYCVWEASELPPLYQEAISQAQEIWTCSQYCCEIFGRHHPQVKYVPHVVERDTHCSDADREYIRRIISYDRKSFYFLMVTKLWDLRKNTRALAAAFQRRRPAMPKAKLIIKVGPQDDAGDLQEDSVIVLREHLDDAQMNALYEIADAYVSPHHSEGWGLTLSDAMILQKPTIATGYSGNCEFMNDENSLLLDFTVDHIKQEDCFYFFDQTMKWAYPSVENLEEKLLFLYHMRDTPEIREKVQNATRDIKKFDRGAVGATIEKRIREIVNSERFSQIVARG